MLSQGLGVQGVVKKERRLYMVDQTRVHVDRVEGLGDFMELEVSPQLCAHTEDQLPSVFYRNPTHPSTSGRFEMPAALCEKKLGRDTGRAPRGMEAESLKLLLPFCQRTRRADPVGFFPCCDWERHSSEPQHRLGKRLPVAGIKVFRGFSTWRDQGWRWMSLCVPRVCFTAEQGPTPWLCPFPPLFLSSVLTGGVARTTEPSRW